MLLEHDTQGAAVRRQMPGFERAQVLSVDDDRAAARSLEHRDEFEHGALAGSRAPGEEYHLAAVDAEGRGAQRLASVRITFGDPIEEDHGVAPTPSTSALAKASASNSPKSPACSPMPMKRIGRFNLRAMASTMPPLAVPSSLVRTRPVTP